mgnify:CR=1 FL=1
MNYSVINIKTILKIGMFALFALFFIGLKLQVSATSLLPGDLFVLTVNGNPDMIELVSRIDLATGTKIYISDNAITSTWAWRSTEWYITLISNAFIPRWTILTLTGTDAGTQYITPSWIATLSRNGNFNFAIAWENILIYQWTWYNQLPTVFLYGFWFWAPPITWITTWTLTSNNSFLPPSLSFWLSAISLTGHSNVQYNCSNTALLDSSFISEINNQTNWNKGSGVFSPSPCIFDFINPVLTIDVLTGQSALTSWHTVSFFVPASEPINTGSFTCADINISWTFLGSAVCDSIIELSPFDHSQFEVRINVTWDGVININILSWTVRDIAWNPNDNSIIINNSILIDQTAPVVVLSWSSFMYLPQWSIYSDTGAVWTDDVDGSGVILLATSGSVNTAVVGSYFLEYSYTDMAGNKGFAIRTIVITDQTPPVVTLSWFNSLIIAQGGSYTEQGATRTDNVDGTGVILIPFSGSVNTLIVGTYILEYTYVDAGGNTGNIVIRTVNVTDQTAPVVTLVGLAIINVTQWWSYSEQGATWIDNVDWSGVILIPTSGSINTLIVGTYILEYTYVDTSGNTGTAVRIVIVYQANGGGMYTGTNLPTPTTQDDIDDIIDVLNSIEIFNPTIDTNTCFTPNNKKTLYQGNNVTQIFRTAHQMLYSYGLTTIPGTLDFAPNRQITRAEAAKFFVNFAEHVLCKQKNKKYDNRFIDLSETSPELQTNIKLSYEYGIFYGSEGGKFKPNSFISSDELIAVIMRLVTGKYDDIPGINRAANYKANLENHTTIRLNDTNRGNLSEVIYDLYKNNDFVLVGSGYLLQ